MSKSRRKRTPRCNRSGKYRFPDKIRAEFVLMKQKDKKAHKRNGEPVRVYPCPHCSGWHLTSRR